LKPKDKKKYDSKCEVYSFGILLWEIAECKIPYERFKNFEEITKEVINGYRESFSPGTGIPDKYRSLVNKAVDRNPDHRPTFVKMLVNFQDFLKEHTFAREELLWLKNAIKEKFIEEIKWNELTDISKVGSGHFGSVFKAYWSKTKDYVVLKKLNNSEDIQKDAFQHEIQMQNRAHTCENIIRFIGITQGT
jgi:serine/threonine protein kinase